MTHFSSQPHVLDVVVKASHRGRLIVIVLLLEIPTYSLRLL